MTRGFREQRSSGGDGFAGFLLGALIGLTLGLLFAPKPGAETRADLANRLTGGQEKLGEGMEQVASCARRRLNGFREIVIAAFQACCAATAERSAELRREVGLK